MDARRAADALKARSAQTDKADAQALSEMLASGWYYPVHVKTMESQRLTALLDAREQLVNVKRQLYGQIREVLRSFGIKISAHAGAKRLDEKVRTSCNRYDALSNGVAALLGTLAQVEMELAELDRKVRQITAVSKPCWHLLSAPNVGTSERKRSRRHRLSKRKATRSEVTRVGIIRQRRRSTSCWEVCVVVATTSPDYHFPVCEAWLRTCARCANALFLHGLSRSFGRCAFPHR
jgi:transposase